MVVYCVKSCVWCVVRCISDLQFNNDRKLQKDIFRIFSIASSLGASRDYSARRNGSILILECAGSTRSAGLVEYGTVLACHNCSTYERLMLNTVQFWIVYLAQRLSEARSWCGLMVNCKGQHPRTFWQNSKNRRPLKKKNTAYLISTHMKW